MIEVGMKDRLFVAVALPAALVAAYCYGWRGDALREAEELDRELGSLVQEEEFPQRRVQAIGRLAASAEELERERALPMPPTRVKGDAAARQAEREETVYRIFREAGIRIVGVEDAENPNAAVGAILKETGACPNAGCRVFALEGEYAAVVAALGEMAVRELAVIPETLELKVGGRNHWSIAIWL